ncbi:hypothetical protein EVAR_43468_1 [Eumeta japonica]|uniref:Uncharacterized protein n=1 Tax=Eumeta variegata TaxID=151549 RepID=A0A4C1Z4A5_EUMVA|nr:hypothetical protein EVAR_43468_1 [Eumeta japonica]
MSWFAELADKAENLLNNLDEKTGVALRNHNILKSQHGKHESECNEGPPWKQKTSRKSVSNNILTSITKANHVPEESKSPLESSSPMSHSPIKKLTGNFKDELSKENKSSCHSETYGLNYSSRNLVEELRSNDASNPEIYFKNRITEITKLNGDKQLLEKNLMELKQENKDLLIRLNILETEIAEKQKENSKNEKDLKCAQNVINELQLELTKTREACQGLQTDWDAYKLRVKNMLIAKDQEIKSLHDEPMQTRETKTFTAELEKLKSDREKLMEDLNHVRNEYNVMKSCMEELESKSHSTEKIVIALRDALREERFAKNRLEVDYETLSKDHKKLQLDSSHTIANLREELVEKEKLTNIQHSPSESDGSSDINTLNAVDYDAIQETLAYEKIQSLTDTLVVKQRKIDSLIAENNMMRIQMEKLEVGLHLWVLLILLTYSPDGQNYKYGNDARY